MKSGDIISKYAQIWQYSIHYSDIWENFTKSVKFWLFLTKMGFSQNHTGTLFFFKNEARKLTFGLVVPLYGI